MREAGLIAGFVFVVAILWLGTLVAAILFCDYVLGSDLYMIGMLPLVLALNSFVIVLLGRRVTRAL